MASQESTIIQDIKILPPGFCMTVSSVTGEVISKRKFWNLPKHSSSPQTSLSGVSTVFEETMQLHMLSDVSLGIFLSGGVDSSAVAAIAKSQADTQVSTYNLSFDEALYDEATYARQVAQSLGTDHHEIKLTQSDFNQNFTAAFESIDQPTFDGINTFFISKAIKDAGITVALAGTGGDELFGGYTFRYEKFLSLTTQNSTPQEKVKAYLQCHERDRVPDQEELFDTKAKFTWDAIYNTLLPYFDNSLSSLEQVFLADYNGKLLYNFNPVNTRILNHFQVEGISPLLSDNIISFATRIPNMQKYDQNKNLGKLPLRELLKKYNAISFVPDQKLGFNVDTKNLWESYGKSICTEYLLDSFIVNDGWINKKWITNYINRDDLDIRYINKFLGLLAFEIWYRLFVTRDMNENEKLQI